MGNNSSMAYLYSSKLEFLNVKNTTRTVIFRSIWKYLVVIDYRPEHPVAVTVIWNPTHLDRIWENGTYVSEHGTDMYVHVYASSCNHERVCTWYVHVRDVMHLYVSCTYTFMK